MQQQGNARRQFTAPQQHRDDPAAAGTSDRRWLPECPERTKHARMVHRQHGARRVEQPMAPQPSITRATYPHNGPLATHWYLHLACGWHGGS